MSKDDLVLVCNGDCGKTTLGMTLKNMSGEFTPVKERPVPDWTCHECIASSAEKVNDEREVTRFFEAASEYVKHVGWHDAEHYSPDCPGCIHTPVIQVVKDDVLVKLPVRSTVGSACWDLFYYGIESVLLVPWEVCLIPTGLHFAVPRGYMVEIRPRSSMGLKGLIIPNSPGTVDSDYRGRILVELLNVGTEQYVVNVGDRIAQMRLVKLDRHGFQVVGKLDETERGPKGHGSSGL